MYEGSQGKSRVSCMRGISANPHQYTGHSSCSCGGEQCTCSAATATPASAIVSPIASCCSSKKPPAENPPSSCCAPAPTPSCCNTEREPKGPKRSSCCSGVRKTKRLRQHSPGPELPPLLLSSLSTSGSEDYVPIPLPAFSELSEMPPISTLASLAGTGCTCGVQCACPGCVEHRGAEYAEATGRSDCADGLCASCAIPQPLPTDDGPSTSSLNFFYKTAASLPPPPENWKYGAGSVNLLNPFDVSQYPPRTVASSSRLGGGDTIPRQDVFQLVNLPKLECCGGDCGCPQGSCSCGKSCDGCCDHHLKARAKARQKEGKEQQVEVAKPVSSSKSNGTRRLGMEVRVIKKKACCS